MSDIKLFESKKVRSHWDAEKEIWYFSIIDVIEILTDSPRPRKYWSALKTKLHNEGSELSQFVGQLNIELSTNCRQFKLKANDGKNVVTGENFLPPAKDKKKLK